MQNQEASNSKHTKQAVVEVKTSSLTGAALNYLLALTEGHNPFIKTIQDQIDELDRDRFSTEGVEKLKGIFEPKIRLTEYDPCPNYAEEWKHGGHFLGKYCISFDFDNGEFMAVIKEPNDRISFSYGPNHLIAAGRAVVTSHYGALVKIPAELFAWCTSRTDEISETPVTDLKTKDGMDLI